MKRGAVWFVAIAIGLIVVVLAFRFQSQPVNALPKTATNSLTRSTNTTRTIPPVSASPGSSKEGQVATNTAAPVGTPPSFDTGDARQRLAAANDTDLLAVKGMLRDYRAMMGENPIGNNVEITRALLGGNSRGAQFSNSQTKVDKDGQVIDRWKHPYFFHQLSRIDMEVRSAGPDGVMWTPDDEVSP